MSAYVRSSVLRGVVGGHDDDDPRVFVGAAAGAGRSGRAVDGRQSTRSVARKPRIVAYRGRMVRDAGRVIA